MPPEWCWTFPSCPSLSPLAPLLACSEVTDYFLGPMMVPLFVSGERRVEWTVYNGQADSGVLFGLNVVLLVLWFWIILEMVLVTGFHSVCPGHGTFLAARLNWRGGCSFDLPFPSLIG